MDYKRRNTNRPLSESVRLFHSLYNVQVDVPYGRCIAKYLTSLEAVRVYTYATCTTTKYRPVDQGADSGFSDQ